MNVISQPLPAASPRPRNRGLRAAVVSPSPAVAFGLGQLLRAAKLANSIMPVKTTFELAPESDFDLIVVDAGANSSVSELRCLKTLRAGRAIILVGSAGLPAADLSRAGIDAALAGDVTAEQLRAVGSLLGSHFVVVNSPPLPTTALAKPPMTPELGSLTARQREVAELLAAGHPNKIIASRLRLAEGTVKIHVTSILKVLGVRNRTQAAALIHKTGCHPS